MDEFPSPPVRPGVDPPSADDALTVAGAPADASAFAGLGGPRRPVGEQPGEQIGPYRLLDKLGEGGFGSVWVAEQHAPIRRRVALKLIKVGMDTASVVARFEAERQALALMDHPNIARVLDAGVTPAGRPYFVMELVKGEPITAYCDRERLGPRDRLSLLATVCRAVQHAHQKGIIHRDLKPSNILVSMVDGAATPKVIDFGIAKAMHAPLTDRTLVTYADAPIGTPAYMSPEQASGSADIDTRTDVYALGVVLYELLTGVLPVDPAQFDGSSWRTMRQTVEPARPSLRLQTMGAEAAGRAAARRADPRSLARLVRGDLDWITLRAMETDRSRRYDSAAALADDIDRHLRSEPVQAGPPSAAYRLGKFATRYRHWVLAGALAVLALVAGLGLAVAGFVEARREAASARAAEIRERDQAQRATAALQRAEQIVAFLKSMLAAVDPREAQGADTTLLRGVLDEAADRISTELATQPEVAAELRHTIGVTYSNLGEYSKAEVHLTASLEARRRLLGEENPETLATWIDLATLRIRQGRFPDARRLFDQTLQRAAAALGPADALTLRARFLLGVIDEQEGKWPDALARHRATLADREASLPPGHPETLASMHAVARVQSYLGDAAEAEAMFRRVLDGRRAALGSTHTDTMVSINDLGEFLKDHGNLDEARALLEEVLDLRRRVQGESHPDTLIAMTNLGTLYQQTGDVDRAEPLLRTVLSERERLLGEDHPQTALAVNNLAALEYAARRDEAEPLMERALEMSRRLRGPDHPQTLIAMVNLGKLRVELGRGADAEPLIAEGVRGFRRTLPEDHWMIGAALHQHGRALAAVGRDREAEQALLDAHRLLAAGFGPAHPRTVVAAGELRRFYDSRGLTEPASAWSAYLAEHVGPDWRRILGDEPDAPEQPPEPAPAEPDNPAARPPG